jgi:hypothetical protein
MPPSPFDPATRLMLHRIMLSAHGDVGAGSMHQRGGASDASVAGCPTRRIPGGADSCVRIGHAGETAEGFKDSLVSGRGRAWSVGVERCGGRIWTGVGRAGVAGGVVIERAHPGVEMEGLRALSCRLCSLFYPLTPRPLNLFTIMRGLLSSSHLTSRCH